jgi:hypothetical protein
MASNDVLSDENACLLHSGTAMNFIYVNSLPGRRGGRLLVTNP